MAEQSPSSKSSLLSAPRQLVAALQNAFEIARLGGVAGEQVKTPYDVELAQPLFRLRHYQAAGKTRGRRPAVVLVPPLMITAEVYDIAADNSAVGVLSQLGLDPWVVDFGAPEQEEGGLGRTLADHILAVSRAVDYVREKTGADVHLAGYSQGGIFAYLAASYRRSEGIASLITFGSPVNVHRDVLPGIPDEIAVPALETLAGVMAFSFSQTAIPAWASRTGFKLLDPVKEVRNQIDFLRQLSDRDSLAKREGTRRFFRDEGWVAWPGPAFSEFIEQMIMGNRLFTGGFVVEGESVTLADLDCPVLAFVGTKDDIARPATVRSVAEAAPRAEIYEAVVHAGHMGMVVGTRALEVTWPTVAGWVLWREGTAARPANVLDIGTGSLVDSSKPKRKSKAAAKSQRKSSKAKADLLGDDADSSVDSSIASLAVSVGRDLFGAMTGVIGDGAGSVRSVAGNLLQQLPRMARLEGLRRYSRVGLAMSLSEQAQAAPTSTFFLYEGHAHSYADANRRVDAIVRGLLSIGVRVGEHVGLLMGTRPTALAVATAINRLGAVAVLLRPDGDLAEELEAGVVDHLIVDPEHAETARKAFVGPVYAMGGVHAVGRSLPRGVVDMETIDPDLVPVPQWYAPSPGTAEDVAFILFAGHGDTLRANRITNRRWALSALGAATATGMNSSDTVYCWTSIQHPTGILVSMSGAVVAGARLALAHGFDADSFWDEVRRYGASIVFYSGAILRGLVDAPPSPAERNHPVRLFAGSGMPASVWRRVVERFSPAGIVEFYASTEGNAILVNLSGDKVGSVGRPLLGSSETMLAAYNMDTGELDYDGFGYARRAAVGSPGVLLARLDRDRGAVEGKPLRSVFERGDLWHSTGDLFVRDSDGDHHRIDKKSDLILIPGGVASAAAIEDVLGALASVSLATAYGIRPEGRDHDVVVAAVVLREGARLDPALITSDLAEKLSGRERPSVIRVVEDLPMTAGFRVLKGALRADGLTPKALRGGVVWDEQARAYCRYNGGQAEPIARLLGQDAPAAAKATTTKKAKSKRKSATKKV